MKKFNFKKVLDGLTSSSAPPAKPETEITETLGSEHFQVSKTVRHGFPYQPTAMAYDPVQHILAIGCKSGSIRLFGRPGVDCHVMHDNDAAVLQLIFLVNEGALVSVCSDDSLHLWNLRQKRPAILHSLKYNRERITYCHLPFQSKWLYIGTERGNVHIANIESFVLSGYVINWNKAIELSQRTHPGPVVSLSDNPTDSTKLLIGFETGMIVQWDLKTKTAECRYACEQQTLHSLAWHHEGKQFMCSHSDGSLSVWNYRSPSKPAQVFQPHGHPAQKGSKPEACRPIMKVAWPTSRTGDPFIVFSDGLPYERSGRRPCITVMQGKSVTVLEMEYPVVNFLPVSSTPWPNDFQDPYAIIVLLENDLVVIDLTTPGYPCFQNPYPMDLHESPVTCCTYYADCPPEMIPAFYTVGSRQQKKTGFSDKNWPVKGGEWGTSTCSYPEIIITGHADGSLKFWDASAVTLQLLYKLRTSKIFEKQPLNQSTEYEEDPFAIVKIAMCCESRILCVAGTSGHVIVYRYNKVETTVDVPTLEIALVYEVDDLDSPDTDQIPPPMPPPSSSVGSAGSGGMPSPSPHHSTSSEGAEKVGSPLLKVKSGPQKMVPGYQVDLCAQLVTVEGEPPSQILCLAINSLYGLMAFGNMQGLAIVDIIQKTTLLNLGTPDLYGSADPYTRTQPRSPQRKKPPAGLGDLGEAQAVEQLQSPQRRKPLKALSKLGESEIGEQERCRSPTTERDESNGVCLSPTGTTRKKLADIKRNRNQPRPRMSKAHSTASMEGNGGDADSKDGSFSRSRSSSMSSLENVSAEGINCLSFTESYTRKTDPVTSPCLWVGTTLGSVLVIVLNLPPQGDQRLTQPVIVSPSGTILRLKGAILAMSFLDCNGMTIPPLFAKWEDPKKKEENREAKDGQSMQRRGWQQLQHLHRQKAPSSPTTETISDRQFVVICSEKQAKVISLPSQTCAYKLNITETSFVCKADVVSIANSVCLACFLANGHIMTFSLPSLRPLLDSDFLPLADMRIAQTFSFSNCGQALYLCTPSEIQRITLAADTCESLQEMLCELFLPVDTPEGPKQSFFKGLFSSPSIVDKEELFGEAASGKASRSVAKHIPGTGGIEGVKAEAGSAMAEVQKARMALVERGEKLSELEERTEALKVGSEMYASSAHQVMEKYKNKKWYQL
ncbi:STXBP5 [Branchiostoma lanceolatum]|uniref:STXBP5 protein n=1 Tax=Branchiostoma lanceolatum TaxID=7740 RepID=A0A8J9VYI4_BRALA|nr:STXBP5 [Branchiostoma lanceolatum]